MSAGSACYVSHAELVSELGEVCTKALLGAFGGLRIYFPAKLGDDHRIVQAIGADNASKVAAMLATGIGGLWVELPLGPSGAHAQIQERLIVLSCDETWTEAQIARELRIHPRTVRRARARLLKADA